MVSSDDCAPPPLEQGVSGTVSGLTVKTVYGINKATKQTVKTPINGASNTWDCGPAGFIVNPGD